MKFFIKLMSEQIITTVTLAKASLLQTVYYDRISTNNVTEVPIGFLYNRKLTLG